MFYPKRLSNEFDPETGILTTVLGGPITLADITEWAAGFRDACLEARQYEEFKVLADHTGYSSDQMQVHMAWRAAFSQLLDEDTVVAFVHHNRVKMQGLHTLHGTEITGYFADYETALEWLLER